MQPVRIALYIDNDKATERMGCLVNVGGQRLDTVKGRCDDKRRKANSHIESLDAGLSSIYANEPTGMQITGLEIYKCKIEGRIAEKWSEGNH